MLLIFQFSCVSPVIRKSCC